MQDTNEYRKQKAKEIKDIKLIAVKQRSKTNSRRRIGKKREIKIDDNPSSLLSNVDSDRDNSNLVSAKELEEVMSEGSRSIEHMIDEKNQ